MYFAYRNKNCNLEVLQTHTLMSTNGMMVSEWGPPGWKFLHSVAHGFPETPDESTQEKYRMFFTLVGSTLPCVLCRDSYNTFISENPVRTTSRADLTRWLWEIHNKVNDKLDRTYKSSDFESVTRSYEIFRAKCSSNSLSKGCTEPLYRGRRRCTIPFFSSSPLLMDCTPLKLLVILSILAFLYSRKHM